MRPVSSKFLAALRGSHEVVARARVVSPGQTGTDPSGEFLTVLGGSVTLDGTADVRSTLDLTVDGTAAWPTNAQSLLAPYGSEVFVERGIAYGGGSREWVSLGYFRIGAVAQDQAPDGPIQLDASDRMVIVQEARMLAPRQFDATATYGDVVTDLVTDAYPAAIIEWDDSTDTEQIGRTLIVEEDRLAAVADVVTAVAKIAYWDHRGILVVKDAPDPGSPVWGITHGHDGVLVSLGRELSRDGVYNAVVASGEAADETPPSRGVAVDSNAASPTWWNGGFGRVPRFYASPLLTSDDQAMKAATSILSRALGLPYSVDFTAIANPALEPLDPVRVSYSDRVSAELHIVETLTIPLVAADAMTGTTREQTLVSIGSMS